MPRRCAAHGLALLAMGAVLAGVLLTVPGTPLTVGNTDLGLTRHRAPGAGLPGGAWGCSSPRYHFLSRRTSALPILLPLIVAAIAAGRTFGPGLLVAASLLQLAAILTSVLMIGEQPDWQAGVAGAIYLTLSALGGMALLFGLVLADLQRLSPGGLVTVPFVVAVLSVGFALQWGVAPLYFWLPNAYQRAGPGAGAVAVCIAGPATLGLLIQSLSALPQLVADESVNRLLMLGGLGTAAFGAGAALAPAKLRRTLGYILVADLGFVIAGLATFSRIGLTGATLHMAHRCLVALLLLAAAAELERVDRGAPDDDRPAPYLWATLLVGSLALVGVPPFSGFAATWAVLQALTLSDGRLVLALGATSLVCLAAVLTALGRLRRSYPRPWRRPTAVEVSLMGLALFAALWGLVPGPALEAVHRAAGAALPQAPLSGPQDRRVRDPGDPGALRQDSSTAATARCARSPSSKVGQSVASPRSAATIRERWKRGKSSKGTSTSGGHGLGLEGDLPRAGQARAAGPKVAVLLHHHAALAAEDLEAAVVLAPVRHLAHLHRPGGAPGEADDERGRVVGADRAPPPIRRVPLGDHGAGEATDGVQGPEPPGQGVHQVHPDVQQGPPAPLLEHAVAQGHGRIGADVLPEGDAEVEDLPHPPLPQHPLHVARAVGGAVGEVDRRGDAGAAGHGDQLLGLRHGQRQGLLAADGHPPAQGGEGHRVVHVVGGGHDHRLRAHLVQHPLVVRAGVGHPPLRGDPLRLLRRRPVEGHQLGFGAFQQAGDEHPLGEGADAGDGDAEPFSHLTFPSRSPGGRARLRRRRSARRTGAAARQRRRAPRRLPGGRSRVSPVARQRS